MSNNLSNELEYVQEELEGVVEHTFTIDTNGEDVTYVAFTDARHEIDINETSGPFITKIAFLGKKFDLTDAQDYHNLLDYINELTTTTVLDNHPELKRTSNVAYAVDADQDLGDLHIQSIVLSYDNMSMVSFSTASRKTKEAVSAGERVVKMVIQNNVDKSHGV